MLKKLAALLLLLGLLLGGAVLFQRRSAPRPKTATLTVFCTASLKKPVEVIAQAYLRDVGIEVRLQFGGSGTLLSQLRIAKQGDLFIAADDGALDDARKAGLLREVVPLAKQHPVLGVRAGNPKGIRAVGDLLREDVRLALANPEAASISRVSKAALGDRWGELAARATVMKPTVTDVAADLALGTVDAAILWDSTVGQFKNIESVEVPELAARIEHASAAVLIFSPQPADALRFARYLGAADKGGAVFREMGFAPADSETGQGTTK